MKTAIITGASSGIGRGVSIALLKDGYQVALVGRRQDKLEETKSLAGHHGQNGLVLQADVTQPESVQHIFDQTSSQFGRIDLLFNNAGIAAPGVNLEDLSIEDWQASVDVNLTAVFLCTREAFRHMKHQDPMGGRIINNGSISATAPRPNSIAYTSTKHAITGLTKSTSLDGRKYNIACGQIDIGNAATAMTEKMKNGVPQANGEFKVEPTMHVDNVAGAILYMANLPLEANVPFMTVMATKMPLIGRG